MSNPKRNVTGKLAAVQAIGNSSNSFNENRRLNDRRFLGRSRDPFIFMVNLLAFIEGETILKRAFDEILVRALNEGEGDIKEILKKLVDDEVVGGTPTNTTLNSIDTSIDANLLDDNNSLKNDYTNNPCLLLLNNGSNNNPLNTLSSSITTPNTNIPLSGNMNITFNNGIFNVNSLSNTEIKNFLKDDFIEEGSFLDVKKIISDILNLIYGVKNNGGVEDDEEIIDIINKIINNDTEDDSFFDFSEEERKAREERINNRKRGVNSIDVGCGELDISLNIEDLCSELANLDNNISSVSNFTGNISNNVSNQVPDEGDKNLTIRNFFRKLMETLKVSIITSVIKNPLVKILLLLICRLKRNCNNTPLNLKEFIRDYLPLIKCIINRIIFLLNKYLFEFLNNILKDLIKDFTKSVINERTLLIRNQLRNLRPI